MQKHLIRYYSLQMLASITNQNFKIGMSLRLGGWLQLSPVSPHNLKYSGTQKWQQ
jgi:hypothetical protein